MILFTNEIHCDDNIAAGLKVDEYLSSLCLVLIRRGRICG